MALNRMRESIRKLGSSTEEYGDPTLMRFLVSKSMDPEKAAKMFVQWQKWRNSMVPNGFIPESEIDRELQTRMIYLQGLTRAGFPLVIIKGNKHSPAKDQAQLKKFIVHLLDKSLASGFKGKEIGDERIVVIIDLQHLTYKNVDPRGLITGFQLFQSYYPERLAKCYILHMPRFFVCVWKMVSRFLEKATEEKIVIVTSKEDGEKFEEEIGEEALPEEYGGRAKLMAIQDVVLPNLHQVPSMQNSKDV